MCRKWEGLQGQLLCCVPPDSTCAEASGKQSGRRLIQQSCWGSKCTCLPPLQRGRGHNHVWVTSCEWLVYVTKHLKCKVYFTVVCKEMLSLTEFLGFLLFMGWPTASLLRKQVTSKQEGETLGSKTKHCLQPLSLFAAWCMLLSWLPPPPAPPSFLFESWRNIISMFEWCLVLRLVQCMVSWKKKTTRFCSKNVLCHVQQWIYWKGNFSSTTRNDCFSTNGGAPLINFFHIREHHNSALANFYPKGKQKPLKIPVWFPITKQTSLQL